MAILGTVPVESAIAPIAADNPTPTHSAAYGLGGLRGVATLSERNSIPLARREANMCVYVLATDTLYVLQDDLETWTPKPFGVTKRRRTLYIDGCGLNSTLTYGSIPWVDSYAPYYRTLEGNLLTGSLEWKMAMPEEWDRSPIKVKYYCMYRGGSVTYTPYVVLYTSIASAPSGTDYTNLAWGTAVVTNSSSTSPEFVTTTAAVTPGGTVSAGSMLFFKLTIGFGSFSGKLEIAGAAIQWRELTSDISPW